MKTLIVAEHEDAAKELCAGARLLANEVVLAFFGEAPSGIADGIARIDVPEGFAVDDAAATIASVFDAEQPDYVLVEPTRSLKTVAGRLAAQVKTAVITDVISFCDDGEKSLYFGGVGEQVQKPLGAVTICTVAPGIFSDESCSGAGDVRMIEWIAPKHPLKVVACEPRQKSGVDLFKADVVVAAGRGFAEKDELPLAYDLADTLGGGVACTRPLTEGVDWFPSECYVGVSGLMLAPKVYIAAGISGQMQHMVGCNRAQALFAINKDKNAPIFSQCDYGLIGDVKEILPVLTANLR